jgi:hypothetical protein
MKGIASRTTAFIGVASAALLFAGFAPAPVGPGGPAARPPHVQTAIVVYKVSCLASVPAAQVLIKNDLGGPTVPAGKTIAYTVRLPMLSGAVTLSTPLAPGDFKGLRPRMQVGSQVRAPGPGASRPPANPDPSVYPLSIEILATFKPCTARVL